MFLKHYLCISYEDLKPPVAKNLMYKRFCRIPFERDVPDETALMKINTKYVEEVISEINDKLLESLVKKKLIKGKKLRIDTTVMEANISYPTDAGLLYRGVKKLTRTVACIRKLCGDSIRLNTPTLRTLKDDLLSIGKVINRRSNDKAKDVRKITSKMSETAKKTAKKALNFANKLIPETSQEVKIRGNLLDIIDKVFKVIEQTETVNSGGSVSDRLVSLADTDARPIKKGKPGRRVEFGYKLQIQETESGVITGYQLYRGNPSDRKLVEEPLNQHKKIFKSPPRDITMDRGYYDSKNEQKAYKAGIKNVCIPKPGRKSKKRMEFENTHTYKRLKRWRAGIEGRISYIKRSYKLNRSMMYGYRNSKLWAGLGIFAHNLLKTGNSML